MRPKPRGSLSWRLVPFDVTEQTPLLARLRAAAKSGLACAPYWGRGLRLVSAAGTELTLEAEAWPWFEADDYLLLRSLEAEAVEVFELVQVESVNGVTFTLKVSLVGTWGEGSWAWPLVFGRLTFSDLSHRTDWHAGVTVTLSELVVRPDPPSWVDICFIDPSGAHEAWNNLLPGEFNLSPLDPQGAVLANLSFSCLGPWRAGLHGPYGAFERWGPLTTFTFTGLTYQFNAHSLAFNAAVYLGPFWRGEFYGLFGGWETWTNLSDGEPEASWTGEQRVFGQDVGHQGLVTWCANSY
ncbi:MAG: hypothetical protein M5U12_30570 [Verrucomicrobia bacterium]|nr:hypothetical protein [Verrucomicrobiota bacterium]